MKSEMITIYLISLAFLTSCEREVMPPAVEPVSVEKKLDPDLSAMPKSAPVPDLGHRLSEEQKGIYHFLPKSMVSKFKHNLKKKIGVVIPNSAGSFVGHGATVWREPTEFEKENYRFSTATLLEHPDISPPDDFDNKYVAFMIPVEDVPAFVEHLKERGEALNESTTPEESSRFNVEHGGKGPPFRFTEREGRGSEGPEMLSYRPSGGPVSSAGFAFFRPDGERQTIGFNIDMDRGVVWYRALVWDDE